MSATASDTVWSSGALQIRVIRALVMRELYTRFGRETLGFLWIAGEPMIFCLGVIVMWSILYPKGEHGIAIIPFVITGYNPLTLWRHCVSRSLKAFESNSALLFHRQVTTTDILTARLLTEYFGCSLGFIITASGAMMLGAMDPPYDLGLVLLGWFYVMLFAAGCAALLAGLSEMNDTLEKFLPVTTYTSIPLSGAFAMVDWIPQKYQWILLLSPSVNAFEMIRGGWMGPRVHPHFDVVYTTWTCLVLLLVGLYVVRKARRFLVIY